MSDVTMTDNNKLYAYTVFDTTKTSPHYSVIKKCVDFKKYTTHTLIINTKSASYSYTFLRLVYSTSSVYNNLDLSNISLNMTNGDSWTLHNNSLSTVSNDQTHVPYDVEKIIDGANCQSIVGLSLSDMIKDILLHINESDSVQLDYKVFTRDDRSLSDYIHLIMDYIRRIDLTLYLGLFLCPRNYFTVSNYTDYAIYFINSIDNLKNSIDEKFYNEYHFDKTLLSQITRVFIRTIKTDYLFINSDILVAMFNFIISTNITANIAIEHTPLYLVESKQNEINITVADPIDPTDEEKQIQQTILHNNRYYFNPYELFEPLQYINLKLISENKKPIELNLNNMLRELYLFADKVDRTRDVTSQNYNSAMQFWINSTDDFGSWVDRPYGINTKNSIKYDLMEKVLTPKQKNKYALTLYNFVKAMKSNEVWPDQKYTYGTSIVKNMLTGLFTSESLEADKTPLNLLIDNFTSDNETRSSMIVKLANAVRDNEKLSAQILDYLTDEELQNKDTFNLINSTVSANNPFNIEWFEKHKDALIRSLKNRFNLSDNISTDQLYAFYIYTHCPEFTKREFITSVTDAIMKNKNSGALSNILDGFFKQKSSSILALFDEIKSQLMKDLFINIFTFKAAQVMFILAMSSDMRKSQEVETILRYSLKLAENKRIHYKACESLLDTAYKSTNSFNTKIVNLLKENTICKTFTAKGIDEDAKIALFADLLRVLSKSFLSQEDQCTIANHYEDDGWRNKTTPYHISDMEGIMKAISLVPECNSAISMFYTEKYLQEH